MRGRCGENTLPAKVLRQAWAVHVEPVRLRDLPRDANTLLTWLFAHREVREAMAHRVCDRKKGVQIPHQREKLMNEYGGPLRLADVREREDPQREREAHSVDVAIEGVDPHADFGRLGAREDGACSCANHVLVESLPQRPPGVFVRTSGEVHPVRAERFVERLDEIQHFFHSLEAASQRIRRRIEVQDEFILLVPVFSAHGNGDRLLGCALHSRGASGTATPALLRHRRDGHV